MFLEEGHYENMVTNPCFKHSVMKNLQIKKLHMPGMILFYVFQVSLYLYSTFKNSKHGLQKC